MKRKVLSKWIATAFVLMVLSASAFLLSVTASDSSDDLDIAYSNLDFVSQIQIVYAVPADSPDVVLLVWTTPQTDYAYGTQKDVVQANATQTTINGLPYTIFEYSGLAAKNMTDVVYARAYNTKTHAYGRVNKYSILQYAYNKLGKTGVASSDQSLKDLLEQMLEYGAAAQKHFEYNQTRPANAEWVEIKTKNGRLSDGFTSGLYLPGDQIVLNAPETSASGTAFLYWQDSAQNEISKFPSFTLTVGASNETYTAVYESCTHVAVVDKAVAPTCTGTGLTVGSHCSLCGKILVAQETVPATGHKEVTVPKKDATCTEDGATDGKQCSVCHVVTVEPEVIPAAHTPVVTTPATPPTCTTVGLTEAAKCSVCEVVLKTQVEIPATGHTFVNGICMVCNESMNGTEGLIYEYNDACEGYVITGIMDTVRGEIVIPGSIDEVPIVGITDNAFYNNDTITAIYILDSEYQMTIGTSAFSLCMNLKSVCIYNGNTVINESAFAECTALTTISAPNGLASIEAYVFAYCYNLNEVHILNISTDSFTINEYAFFDCESIQTIKFGGKKEEWELIAGSVQWKSLFTVECSDGTLTQYP